MGDGFGVIKAMCIKVFNESKPVSLINIDLESRPYVHAIL